ncbi:SurA N-terminal domain-containing protein [Wenjunlia tyrosinilytica]|uniref:Lipoprotein n=1 Tax=Wenjunlia tyrosinilytica TaxID=1544741 RepID=A0A917ZNS4_9ACTN|nr:SurA N-terminal domain-containing protein [Wenjunlia tyrosinilytica]GGO88283.1 lipoprotein [Wenjunlia tyrosinilytica]
MIRRSAASTSPVRRTAVLAAGGLLVGLPLLSACGTPHAGAAAVVEGDQITVSTLQHKVDAVRAAQAKSPNAEQLSANSAKLTGATLNGLVFDRVIARAAKDAGVGVSRAELQSFIRAQEKMLGGEDALRSTLLEQQGVVPGDVEQFFRTELRVQKLSKAKGADLNTPQGQRQIGDLLAKTSKSMGIDVNPRYGKWNADRIAIETAQDKWLRVRPATRDGGAVAPGEPQPQQ